MLYPRKISLSVPRSWAQCSKEQLETIAAELIAEQATASLVPQDMTALKVRLFFDFAGLRIVGQSEAEDEEDRYFLCVSASNKNAMPFPIYAWQVSSWIEKELDWLDKPCTGLVSLPYPTIRLRKNIFQRKKFYGPAVLMQDFSWQRYRMVQDYLQLYYRQQNMLVALGRKNMHRKKNRQAFLVQMKKTTETRSMFLSLLFLPERKIIDKDTGRRKKVVSYDYSVSVENAKYFNHFDEVKFQVVLMWWTGIMTYLQSKYPHVFKTTDVKANAKVNPLDVYARMAATMEKHIGIDEERLNNENFYIVLQHTEDIAVTNEEYEKIKRK